ncbi:hypothetical protein IWX81_001702 [Salinibacterium sp. CAN_S4]|uniref:hypothetical protein n=1 Tax=Salinibacterium sp. CAN_S4 TaxID=2787727 RepID=UPI0018EF595C
MSTLQAPASKEVIEAIINRAAEAAKDFGNDIETQIREASQLPLDAASAERLYTAILLIVKGVVPGTPAGDEASAKIRAEVTALVESVSRPAAPTVSKPIPHIELSSRNGLTAHDVNPVPQFNGTSVPMREGYVDVTLLDPWAENERVTLYVDEFESKNGRRPEPAELLQILTGEINIGGGDRDPFDLRPLARNIARKGVERPPIITREGVPHDGNRRIAASRLVVQSAEFTPEEKERARWIKVWQTDKDVTPDQLAQIVVALNFEEDFKKPWPEYVKARLVVREYRAQQETLPKLPKAKDLTQLKNAVATKYAIKAADVTRYLRMVQWADDFMDYNIEAGREKAEVAYRTDTIFQWFYEIEAGPAGSKVTEQFESDPELRSMIYDMMYDATFDSGAQVRAMFQVVADDDAYRQLTEAHQIRETRQKEARELVKDAINDARQRARAKKSIGLEEYVRAAIKRLSDTPTKAWETLDDELLIGLRKTLMGTLGAINGELSTRGDALATVEVE